MTLARSLFAMIFLVSVSAFSSNEQAQLNRAIMSVEDRIDAPSAIALLSHFGESHFDLVVARDTPNWTEIWGHLRARGLVVPRNITKLKAALNSAGNPEALRLAEAYGKDANAKLADFFTSLQGTLTLGQVRTMLSHLGFSKSTISQFTGPYEIKWLQIWATLETKHGMTLGHIPAFLAKVRGAARATPELGVLVAALETYLASI